MTKTILIIDDDLTMLKLTEETLRTKDYNVLVAANSVDGLGMARRENPSLIVLDIVMSKMNGYEVLKELKDDSSMKHIPVVMCSVKGHEDEIQQALSLGASDYIAKPFHMGLLIKRLENVLKNART